MDWHIIPAAEKANTDFLGSLQVVCQFNTHLCPLCMLRLLQSLGKIGNLFYHRGKCLLGLEECPTVFILLKYLQPAEAYN
jgi:hypothetical protein